MIVWARSQVGRWFRLRAENTATPNQQGPVETARFGDDKDAAAQRLYVQLAADSDHSALLWRLLCGKEPLDERPPLSYSYPVYPD